MSSIRTVQLFDLDQFFHKELLLSSEYPWDALQKLNTYLLQQPLGEIEVEIPEGAFLINPETISIGKGTVIEPGAYIKGPCIIGENCQIRHGAYIRGNVLIGDRCVVGHASELKTVIMLNESLAPHFAYVGDSILGNRVNLGAGTICSNLRMDHAEIIVKLNGDQWRSGSKKLGAILGDGTQTGCNSVCNPGTITGKNVSIFPCMHVTGVIPENSIVKMRDKPVVVPQ